MTNLTFSNLDLSHEMMRAITEMGFEEPTPIQEECIPLILAGNDLVGQAQTGTGKTAAFGIPLVEQIDLSANQTQVLIQCPTRELAIQVTGELLKLAKFKGHLNVVPVYGGQSINRQIKALKRGAHIVVGTPGRTIDHLKRGTLKLDNLKQLVFDEADEMLNMGFRDDMEEILTYTGGPVQKIMFSATVPGAIKGIMKRFMNDPKMVTMERKAVTAPNIQQLLVEVRDSVRTEAICRFMELEDYKLALVFCNTKRKTEQVANELRGRGYASDLINGDLSQNQRDQVMDKFRKGHIDILVATDVAARGIDVDDVEAVFNYDVPQDPEYYVHRIGRTGRAGRSGVAITFATRRKKKQVRSIEKQIKTKLDRGNMPSESDVRDSRVSNKLEKVIETLEKGSLREYIEMIEKFPNEEYTSIEIAAALLKLNLEGQKQSAPMKAVQNGRKATRSNGHAGGRSNGHGSSAPQKHYDDSSMVTLFFGIGKNNRVGPGDLVGAIAGETGLPGNIVGNIDIHARHSFVDIPNDHVQRVIGVMSNARIKGRKLQARVA